MAAADDSSAPLDVELVVEIAGFLRDRPEGASIDEVQVAVRRRRQAVLEVLSTRAFQASLAPNVGSRKRKVYRLAPEAASRQGTLGNGASEQPTHNEIVLARLRRGPATHHELYGLGVVAHSRISDLRQRGHLILRKRSTGLNGKAVHTYTLVDSDRVAA